MKNIGKMAYRFFLTFLLIVFAPFSLAAISVDIDRDPIIANESFQLIFTSDEKIDADPDFSALNHRFSILNKGMSSETKIINGKMSHYQKWILTVITDQTGALTIPSINFGNDLSQSRTINVLAAAPTTHKNQIPEAEIEVQVDTTSPYVQAQVLYTVKLYIKRTISIHNPTLSEPISRNGQAIIEQLGQDQQYQTQRNGIHYDVIERQYAIFPQTSGKLSITPLTFQAITGNQFLLFDPFSKQPARKLIKHSKSIQLEVKPIPIHFTGDTWLPAKELVIQEQWSISPENLQQDQDATRTLILKAVGLTASQLPLPNSQIQKQLKQYPDQPEFENKHDGNDYIGIRRDKMAIIPIASGDFILPAIRLNWWNTTTDSMAIAELPERRLHVAATDPKNTNQHPIPRINNEIINTQKTIDEQTANTDLKPLLNWQYISLLFLILWLATLFCWWRHHNRPSKKERGEKKQKHHHVYLKKLQQACKKNNPNEAKQALLQWANTNWQNANMVSITAIKKYGDLEFQQKLDELNHQLYGKATGDWDGTLFLACFQSQSFKDQNKLEPYHSQLEPLYKTNA